MSKPPGNREQLHSAIPGLWPRGDTQQQTLILQVGENAPRPFMCNEVGKEICWFREVLERLVRDGKCELKLIVIPDCLYEYGALVFSAPSEGR